MQNLLVVAWSPSTFFPHGHRVHGTLNNWGNVRGHLAHVGSLWHSPSHLGSPCWQDSLFFIHEFVYEALQNLQRKHPCVIMTKFPSTATPTLQYLDKEIGVSSAPASRTSLCSPPLQVSFVPDELSSNLPAGESSLKSINRVSSSLTIIGQEIGLKNGTPTVFAPTFGQIGGSARYHL